MTDRTPSARFVRPLLREHADGLTLKQISAAPGLNVDSLRRALYAMPDAYIDRWERSGKRQYVAVWCVVNVPEHCPRPGS